MILTCASCTTRYYADDELIGPNGRSVRCAACGHTWFAEPQLVLDGAAAEGPKRPPLTRDHVERMRRQANAPGPAPSAAARFRQQQAERVRRERVRAAAIAWGATGAAMAATVTGVVAFRQDVAQLWPNSASAFSALGLDVNVYGLEIYDLQVTREFDGPTPIVVVTGEVRNIGGDEKPMPPLRFVLRDEHSNAVFEFVHALPTGSIGAGSAMPFSVRLENPPLNAVDLEASFASPGEVTVSAPAAPSLEPQPEAPLELGPESAAPVPGEVGVSADPAVTSEPHASNLEVGDYGTDLLPLRTGTYSAG